MRPNTSFTESELNRLMDQLDEAPEEQLRYQRSPFDPAEAGRVGKRAMGVRCKYTHPAGGTSESRVTVRNLGATGLSFISFGMLHPGTKLELQIKDLAERPVTVHAVVRACTHVKGMAHDLDVEILTPLELERFVPEQRLRRFNVQRAAAVDTLAGTLLLCNDDALENKVIELHLGKSRLTITRAEHTGQMLDAVQQTDLDVVILNWDSDAFGAEALGRLRASGYDGPVVLTVAGLTTPQQEELAETLAAIVLARPFRAEDVVKAVARAIDQGARRQRYALTSTLGSDDRSAEIVRLYISAVQRQVSGLPQAGLARSADELASMCRMLRDSGSSFGFDGISEMARAIVQKAEAGDLADVDVLFRKLRLYIARISAGYGVTEPAAAA